MKRELQQAAQTVNARLDQLLSGQEFLETLKNAMRYSVMAGGKRLRPILNLWANELLSGNVEETLDYACALEMIHTYSLIHDDLPAMDNDTMRRGKPTNHVVFGEAYAILAGDALLNYAFEVMVNQALKYPANMTNHLLAAKCISDAAGPFGMIAGQCCDIEDEGKTLTGEELNFVHTRKTGAMITASLLSGLYLNKPTREEVAAVKLYGNNIGLAFQVLDDILDVTGDEQNMGKTLNKDETSGKLTYVKLYGVDQSRRIAADLTEEAVCALARFGANAEKLVWLARYLENRDH